jgi:two-component system cell cycle sensor histidine kinase/response regulator CckA
LALFLNSKPQDKLGQGPYEAFARARTLLALAVFSTLLSIIVPTGQISLAIQAIALTLAAISVLIFLLSRKHLAKQGSDLDVIANFIAKDTVPSFVASADGEILVSNRAAAAEFDLNVSPALAGVLKASFANPSGILLRLQSQAAAAGNAHEEVVTRSGQIRLNVHQIAQDSFVWRIVTITAQTPPRAAQESQSLPMIMVGRTDAILFMNEAARRMIGSRVKSLDRIFMEMPLVPGSVCTITTADGPQHAFVAEVQAGTGRRALYLLPPPDAESGPQKWQAFQDLPVPMIKVASDGSIQAFNRKAAKLVGVALEKDVHLSESMEGLGRSITDWLSDTLADRMVQKSEFLRLKLGDHEVFVQVTLNRIIEDGAPALIAVMHDATELKSLEAKFVQSQKMQAIGQLEGGVAHDFNNLLTAIAGHCDLLLLRHDQGDPDYSDLMQINQNSNRAAALVGQLLAFSRKQTLRPETLDMRDTLSDLTHLLNRLVGEKVTLTLCNDPVLKPIRADKRQLEQVLMNLVVNARDAMPEGGEIRIVTESTIDP